MVAAFVSESFVSMNFRPNGITDCERLVLPPITQLSTHASTVYVGMAPYTPSFFHPYDHQHPLFFATLANTHQLQGSVQYRSRLLCPTYSSLMFQDLCRVLIKRQQNQKQQPQKEKARGRTATKMPMERKICCIPVFYFHSRPARPVSLSPHSTPSGTPVVSIGNGTSYHIERSPPARPRLLSQIPPVQTVASIAPETHQEPASQPESASAPENISDLQYRTTGRLVSRPPSPNIDRPVEEDTTLVRHPTRASLSPNFPAPAAGVPQARLPMDPVGQPLQPVPPQGFFRTRLSSFDPTKTLRRVRQSINPSVYGGTSPGSQRNLSPPGDDPLDFSSSWLGGHPADSSSPTPPIRSLGQYQQPVHLSPISEQVSPLTRPAPLPLRPLSYPPHTHASAIPASHQRSISTVHPSYTYNTQQTDTQYIYRGPELLPPSQLPSATEFALGTIHHSPDQRSLSSAPSSPPYSRRYLNTPLTELIPGHLPPLPPRGQYGVLPITTGEPIVQPLQPHIHHLSLTASTAALQQGPTDHQSYKSGRYRNISNLRIDPHWPSRNWIPDTLTRFADHIGLKYSDLDDVFEKDGDEQPQLFNTIPTNPTNPTNTGFDDIGLSQDDGNVNAGPVQDEDSTIIVAGRMEEERQQVRDSLATASDHVGHLREAEQVQVQEEKIQEQGDATATTRRTRSAL